KGSLDSGDTNLNLAISQAIYAIGCLREDEYKQKLISLLIDTCQEDMINSMGAASPLIRLALNTGKSTPLMEKFNKETIT
ncbi:MAG TPA: hypothetical protein VHP38_07910, partial [Ruminiclostridium sp.]|nr:hypothetical protein [Ruminiclostridium sp.]